MPRQSSAAAQSDASHEIEVDTDQADIKKAINRQAPAETERSERGNAFQSDESAEENRHSQWLERNRAVQKRFGRMQRNFDQRMANEQAERQRERRELQAQIESLKVNRGSDTSTDAAHEAEISTLQSQIEAAHEAGNSKEVARLTTLIASKMAAHMQAKTDAMLQKQRSTQQEQRREDVGTQRVNQTKAQRFIEQTEWWDDPDYEAEKSYANTLFAKFKEEEGMDPESNAIYRKINRQLKAKFPTLKVTDPDELDSESDDDEIEAEDKRPIRRAPVQNFKDRGVEQEGNRRAGTRLDENDIATMRAMKMDPNDDKAVLAYARSKREMAEA